MANDVTTTVDNVPVDPTDFAKSDCGSGEGSWRGPFYGMGELGGMFQMDALGDGWQKNLERNTFDARLIPAVYACVMANARALSQCYAQHRRIDKQGKHQIVKSSDAATMMRRPNIYETWPQFITNMVAEMQFEGESFALAIRDDRGRVIGLHKCPRHSTAPYVAEDGTVFYSVGANPMRPQEQEYMVPSRDVLHLRQYAPRHPLIGESPIKAAAMAAGVNVSLSRSQAAFFHRMSRPSGVLSTDVVLNKEQLGVLREAWREQSQGLNQGGIPILGGGMKFHQMSITAQDAQLIEAQKMSINDLARVFGVPLPVIGELENSTLNNVEQLVSLWLSVSLGALLENIERSFDQLFNFNINNYIHLDTQALLRTDMESRVNSLAKGVQGAILTPNEARAKEGLHPIESGDDLYAQVQMQPLGTPLNPEPKAEEPKPPTPAEEIDEGKQVSPEDASLLLKGLLH